MTYSPNIKAVESTNNSTTTPLGIGGVFTGTADDVLQYSEITVGYNTDQAGASNGLTMQTSTDGTNWDVSIKITPPTVPGGYGGTHTLVVATRYFRIVYTNGAVAQTHFRLQVLFHPHKSKDLTSRSNQVLSKVNDVGLTRPVSEPKYDRNSGLIGYMAQNRKFGVNQAVGNGAFEDIIVAGGTMTHPTSAETIRVRAGGDAADDTAGAGAREVTLTFLDENWNEVTETLTTAGASASSTTTALCIGLNKIQVTVVGTYGESNTGDIIVEQSTSGIEVGRVAVGIGNTQQAVLHVPAGKECYVTSFKVSVGFSDSADVRLWHIDNADDVTTPFASVKHVEFTIEDFSGLTVDQLGTFLKFDEKNIIGVDAKRITGSGSARVSVDFDYVLVDLNGS